MLIRWARSGPHGGGGGEIEARGDGRRRPVVDAGHTVVVVARVVAVVPVAERRYPPVLARPPAVGRHRLQEHEQLYALYNRSRKDESRTKMQCNAIQERLDRRTVFSVIVFLDE